MTLQGPRLIYAGTEVISSVVIPDSSSITYIGDCSTISLFILPSGTHSCVSHHQVRDAPSTLLSGVHQHPKNDSNGPD